MGKKNYTNGIITKRFGEDDIIPDGWYRGVAPMSEEKKKEMVEKRKQTNLKKYGVENPSQAKEIKDKKKSTFLKKYGVENPAQVDGAIEKAKKTNLERYGVENPSQLEDIKRKKRETTSKNYGVEYPMQSGEIREKSKQTVLEKYGVEHISKVEEIKDKKKNTFLEKYKVDNPMKSDEIKDKLKHTVLEKYGVDCTFKDKEVKEKIKKTNIERYGTEYPFQAEEVKEKIKKTNLDRYGVENPFSSKEIQGKIKETNIENLGVPYPMMSKDVQEKSKKTSLEVYGTEYPNQSDIVKKRIVESNIEKYGVKYPSQSSEVLHKIVSTNLEKYGVDWTCLLSEVRVGSNNSKPNRTFADILSNCNISYEREFSLKRYSYDFKVGNTLIEINPTATHNTLWNPYGNREGIDKLYHYNKSKTAKENGYHCIHIFDWDDVDKIVNMLKPKERVYARKCEVRNVSDGEARLFLNTNHLQGYCRGQEVKLGLYYNNELISLMTFGKPRYNKNYQYELLRYCSIKNVIGGAEKLFKAFIKKYDPKSIISYCDRAKFIGNVYSKLGFIKKESESVSKHWYSLKEKRHITDNLLRSIGYDKLFRESYGKGTSNEELIILRGYVSVYDCGQDVWSYYN